MAGTDQDPTTVADKAAVKSAVDASGPPPPKRALSHPWVAHIATALNCGGGTPGDTFYFNTVTGLVQWDFPAAGTPPPKGSASAASAASVASAAEVKPTTGGMSLEMKRKIAEKKAAALVRKTVKCTEAAKRQKDKLAEKHLSRKCAPEHRFPGVAIAVTTVPSSPALFPLVAGCGWTRGCAVSACAGMGLWKQQSPADPRLKKDMELSAHQKRLVTQAGKGKNIFVTGYKWPRATLFSWHPRTVVMVRCHSRKG